jgi:hypothetical protein
MVALDPIFAELNKLDLRLNGLRWRVQKSTRSIDACFDANTEKTHHVKVDEAVSGDTDGLCSDLVAH